MMRTNFCISLCLFIVMPLSVSHAAGTLTRDDRSLDVAADATDSGGGNVVDPMAISPNFGDDWIQSFDTGQVLSTNAAAMASAFASQNSTYDASPVFSSLSAGGTIDINGTTDAFDVNNIGASASSVFEIEFSIASMLSYTLDGSIQESGGRSIGRVTLRPASGLTIFNADESGPFSDSGVLAPGDYELYGEASAVGFADGGDSINLSASYSINFIIPEPASGLLILVGGMLINRRRASR